ncbi:polysaccharide pyruvyl transferase [Clostridium sporogenes]
MNNTFLLAGNGPYENHGCEAIVKGSIEIINNSYKDTEYIVSSYYHDNEQFLKQKQSENNKNIMHLDHIVNKRFSKQWMISNFAGICSSNIKRFYKFNNLKKYVAKSRAVLSIGGDNYTLDYGKPNNFVDLDSYVIKQNKPIIIWGASIGPFSKDREYENFMSEHLKKVNAIFAREPMTVEYLDTIGVRDNVYRVCDPAFCLQPNKIDGLRILKNSIGINISPIMEKCVSEKSSEDFIKLSAKVIEKLIEETGKIIYLIPHVVIKGNNDYELMKSIFDKIGDGLKSKVILVEDTYNAAEYKWIISQMEVFFGARTHATIASLSTLVPTLSFVYSMKSIGINKDLFGGDEYCIYPNQFNEEELIQKIKYLLHNKEQIKSKLKIRVSDSKKLAIKAGEYLKTIIG